MGVMVQNKVACFLWPTVYNNNSQIYNAHKAENSKKQNQNQ